MQQPPLAVSCKRLNARVDLSRDVGEIFADRSRLSSLLRLRCCRPLAESPVVAAKALVTLMRVLQQGKHGLAMSPARWSYVGIASTATIRFCALCLSPSPVHIRLCTFSAMELYSA